MNPTHYLHAFLRFRWLVLLASFAGAALLLTIDAVAPATYTSSANVLVVTTPAGALSSSDAYTSNLLAQERMPTYADIARGPSLAEEVTEKLDLALSPGDLQDRIDVAVSDGSTVLRLVVRDTDPDRARKVATSAADSMVNFIDAAEAGRGQGKTLLRARLSGQAETATVASPPPPWRNPIIGAAGGLALGLALAAAATRLDRRVTDETTVVDALSAPVLGVLPAAGSRSHRFGRSARAGYSEAMREVRSSIFFLRPSTDKCLTVALASPHPVDELPRVAGDLATALADTGSRVLLVDADLHGSGQPPLLDQEVEESAGLTGYLTRAGVEGRVVWHDDASGVDVVPAGLAAPNGADLLHSDAFAALLTNFAQRYDFVLVIAPATTRGSGALAVAAICDGILLVVEEQTRKEQLREASQQLRRVNADVLGAIFLS